MRDRIGHGLEELEHFVEDKVPFHLRRYWRWPAIAVAALVVPLALGLWTFRLVEPLVPQYRVDAEAFATRTLGWPVRIERMWLGWHWFGPEVVLSGVRVLAPGEATDERVLIRADEVRVGVAPGDFLRGGEFRPARVVFEAPKVALEVTPDGKVLLAGEQVGDLSGQTQDWRPLLSRLLAHGRVEVQDGDLIWHDRRAGLGPVRLAPVQAALESDGDEHEAELDVRLPADLGRRLVLEVAAEGAADSPEDWQWQGRLVADGVRVAWLQTHLRADALYRPSGVIDLDAEVRAAGTTLTALSGRVQARELTVAPRGEEPRFLPDGSGIDLLDAGFEWRREDAAWRLAIEDLSVRRGTRAWRSEGMRLGFTPADTGTRLTGDAALIRIEDLALLGSWLPREVFPYTADLLDAAPSGDLGGLEFELELAAGGELRDYRVAVDLSGIGFERSARAPGVRGLTGRLEARRAGGSLALDARGLAVDTGRLFRAPLEFAHLRGALSWTRVAEGFSLRGDDLVIDDPRAQVAAAFLYRATADGEPHLLLEGTLRDGDLAAKSAFLPVGVMKPNLVEWLDRAVVAGTVSEASFRIDGPLRRFPFRGGEGEFEVDFHVDGGVLDYSPGWPRAEGVSADIRFHNIGLWLSGASGRAAGVPFTGASASLPDLRALELEVIARHQGPAEALADFVRASPLVERFGGLLAELSVRGPSSTAVSIVLPVRTPEAIRVAVDTTLAGARADVRGLPFGARRLTGKLHFTERSVRGEDLRGEVLGAPLSLDLASEPDGTTRLGMAARVGLAPLARALKLPLERVASGTLPVRATVRVPPRESGAPLALDLESDLTGLAVELPAPLGKPATAPGSVRAELRFPDRDSLDLAVAWGEHTRGRYAFVRRERSWGLVGDDAAHLEVQAPVVDVRAWLAAGSGGEGGAALDLPFRTLHLRAGRLSAWGQDLTGTDLQLERLPDAWAVRIASADSEGLLRVPDDRNAFPIEADFERLWLGAPDATDQAGDDQPTDPRGLPAFTVRIGSLRYAGADLGSVEAVIERRPWGLTLTSLRAEGGSLTLEGTGRWEHESGRSRTRVEARLVSTAVARTLLALGFAPAVEAERGTLEVALDWPGGPFDEPLARLAGTVKLEVGSGRLRDVQPGGASRALGLFSLGALPRRLLLDFRDVVREGLAFDTIRGDFLIDQGQAWTTNLRLQGANLSMLLVGRTGLASRDYDQLASIDTSLGATLPVAGALAGGPAMAAAALVVSQIFKRTLADATRVHYRITGPWDAPVIERATAEEARR